MEVIGPEQLPVASLTWHRQGRYTLTFVSKVTYQLHSGVCALAEHQEELNEEENYWDYDDDRSLYAPNDLVPLKPSGDVLLVGHAFAPNKVPVRSIVARLFISKIDKSIEVLCDRTRGPDGSVQEGPLFVKMSLRYERAAHGRKNPVGVRLDAVDAAGRISLPNLQRLRWTAGSPDDVVEPIGFGPIAPIWPERVQRLPENSAHWPSTKRSEEPIPEGIDPAYFNSAPPDQWLDTIQADEALQLENLNPNHPMLVTRLPGDRLRARVERPEIPPEELTMRADTLWIDTDRAICTVTWRGQLRLRHRDEDGRIVIQMQRGADVGLRSGPMGTVINEPPSTDDAWANTLGAKAQPDGDTVPLSMDPQTTIKPGMNLAPVLPFVQPSERGTAPPATIALSSYPTSPRTAGDTQELSAIVASLRGGGLPFASSSASADLGATVRFPSTPDPESFSAALSTPEPPKPVDVPPPALMALPLIAPLQDSASSPWAAKVEGPANAPPDLMLHVVPPSLVTPLPSSPLGAFQDPSIAQAPKHDEGGAPRRSGSRSSQGASKAPGRQPQVASVAALAAGKRGGALSAAALSDAAIGEAARDGAGPSQAAEDVPPRARLPTARVELLCFDPAYLPSIRAHDDWKDLLADPSEKVDNKASKEAASQGRPRGDASTGQDMAKVMALGTPLDAAGISMTAAASINDFGVFSPPLALVEGELEFPFDEVEALKVIVTMVTPFIAGDKRLRDVVDSVNEAIKTPYLQAASGIAEKLTAQVKDTFAQATRAVPLKYIEAQAERTLTEQRCHQKRTVVGQPCLRTLLTIPGGTEPVPAYLPASIARDLPICNRMRVRAIAEIRLQLDQYERPPHALRVVGLGRVVSAFVR